MTKTSKNWILAIIVISQFLCCSIWFASNGVMDQIVKVFDLTPNAIGHLTSSVQLGFITGTFVFAYLTIADRFSPMKVFFICSILGALFNGAMIIEGQMIASLISFRFLTGFCLAGIYPVGMKIASDHYKEGLGLSLGYLVGALVVGTALPHLLKNELSDFPWQYVIATTSGLSILGGSLILMFVPTGPYRKALSHFNPRALFEVFRDYRFRQAAFGYFGHMWELYAFWAFVPICIYQFNLSFQFSINVSLSSFFIIAGGGLACVLGGYVSRIKGPKWVAAISLSVSGICCLVSPLIIGTPSGVLLTSFLIIWGMFVVSDSPQFSTLVARFSKMEFRGTALTIVNCTGFAMTIVSIQLLNYLSDVLPVKYIFLPLAIGPIFGIIGLFGTKVRQKRTF